MTVSLIRQIFGELLRRPHPTLEEIAGVISDTLRRNEESRIYAYYQHTNRFPRPRQPNIRLEDDDP